MEGRGGEGKGHEPPPTIWRKFTPPRVIMVRVTGRMHSIGVSMHTPGRLHNGRWYAYGRPYA